MAMDHRSVQLNPVPSTGSGRSEAEAPCHGVEYQPLVGPPGAPPSSDGPQGHHSRSGPLTHPTTVPSGLEP